LLYKIKFKSKKKKKKIQNKENLKFEL